MGLPPGNETARSPGVGGRALVVVGAGRGGRQVAAGPP